MDASDRKKTKKLLNVPLFVGTLVAAAVLGPAAYAWWSFQVNRTADVFLHRADTLEDEEKWEQAARYLHRYLRLRPDETDVRIRVARTFDKSAQDVRRKQQAVALYYRALGVAPASEQPALRRRLAELLLEVGEFEAAETEAEKLLAVSQEDPDGRRLLALALHGQLRSGALAGTRRQTTHVLEALEDAFRLNANQGNIELSAALAGIYRDAQQLADDELGAILARIYPAGDNPVPDESSSLHARIARADANDLPKELAAIWDDLVSDAAEASEKRLSALLKAWCHAEKPLARQHRPAVLNATRAILAGDVMAQMVAASPDDPEALLARYAYRMRYEVPGAGEGELDAALKRAEEDLEAALKCGPDNLAVLFAAAVRARQEAGNIQRSGGSAEDVRKAFEQACDYYQRAIDADSSSQQAYLSLGEVFAAMDEVDQAIDVWRRGLENSDDEDIGAILFLPAWAELLIDKNRLREAWIPEPDPNNPEEKEEAKTKPLYRLGRAIKALAPRLKRTARLAYERRNALLQGKWFAANGDYLKAVPLLARVASGPKASPDEIAQVVETSSILGNVYALLNQWDQAANAYEQVVRLRPQGADAGSGTLRALLVAADAWVRAGRPETGIRHYERALEIADIPGIRLALARAEFQVQARLPSADRNWRNFEKTLDEVKSRRASLAEPWQADLLEVSYLQATGDEKAEAQEKARQVRDRLREAEKENPKSEELKQTLVLVYEQLGFPEDANRALAELEKLAPQSPASCVLRATLHSRRAEYEDARRELEQGLKTLPPTAHAAIQVALVQLSLDQGQLGEAEDRLGQLHEKFPTNVTFVRQLADLAMERNDAQELERWEKKLRELEGPEGSYWRVCRAQRLLALSRNAEDPRFIEASELQAEIQSRRPAWPQGHLLGGLVFQASGRYEEAVEAYERAIRLGYRRISVYDRLIALLYRIQRFDEAQRYLAQIEERVPSSPRLSTFQVSMAARSGELDRALDAARRGAESRPKDPTARIWLGQMLYLNGEAEQAEKAFQKAVELAAQAVGPYSALFAFYVRSGQSERARETLDQLVKNTDLSGEQRAFVLAQGHQLLGDREQAEANYREAMRLAPENVTVQRRLASFLLQYDAPAAEKELRHLLQLAPGDGDARRMLALLLAARGEDDGWREAEQLLQPTDSDGKPSTRDRQLLAALLAGRGTEGDLERATQLLEKAIADSKGESADARVQLARLYERQANAYRLEARLYEQLQTEETDGQKDHEPAKPEEAAKQGPSRSDQEADGERAKRKKSKDRYDSLLNKARQQYLTLVRRSEPNPSHLQAYVDLLIRHGLHDDAEPWLARLKEQTPDDSDLGAMYLEARLLHARDRDSEVEGRVEQLAKKLLDSAETSDQEEAGVIAQIGNLYASLDRGEAAERWYQRLLELKPERYEGLALSLAEQGRVREAIHICLDAAESDDSLRPANVLASVLVERPPTEEESRLAEPLLSKALEEHKDNVQFLFQMGNVRTAQERFEEAARLYQQVLQQNPRNLLALNNLAVVLSEIPDKRKEALDYIHQAIDLYGERELLLDTKGMVLLLSGQPQEAVKCFEDAAKAASADSRYYFHLAMAHQKLGETDKARSAIKEAMKGGLANEFLTRTEQDLFAQHVAGLLPNEYASVAAVLARMGRTTDAIRVCAEAADSAGSLGPAKALAAVLTIPLPVQPTQKDFEFAEPLLQKAAEEHGDDPELLSTLGTVRVAQQQNEEAIELYRRALDLGPENAGTLIGLLNNLATLLGEQSATRQEALERIDQAIGLAGPLPPLLDTKGTILVYDGNTDKGADLLEQAASGPKTDPRVHLHLALAYKRGGNEAKARAALETARGANLAGQILTPTDQNHLAELEKELGQ
jgi:tetratricopeptide (TPR) repeat protein